MLKPPVIQRGFRYGDFGEEQRRSCIAPVVVPLLEFAICVARRATGSRLCL